jgi:hypothetical protein
MRPPACKASWWWKAEDKIAVVEPAVIGWQCAGRLIPLSWIRLGYLRAAAKKGARDARVWEAVLPMTEGLVRALAGWQFLTAQTGITK